jgi:hypothetical protein
MRKKRTKKEIKFEPANYDYMDDKMPLIGWVWEFARRSDEYKKYWDKFLKLYDMGNQFDMKKYMMNWKPIEELKLKEKESPLGTSFLSTSEPSQKWSKESDDFYMSELSKSNPIEVINLKWAIYEKTEVLLSVDKSKAKYGPGYEKVPHAPVDIVEDEGTRTLTYYPYSYGAIHPLSRLKPHFGNENIVMALIDLSTPASIRKILKSLESKLYEWRKALNLPKVRDAKTSKKYGSPSTKVKIWKDYLMTYDLRHKGYKIRDIASILYPKRPHLNPHNADCKICKKIKAHLKEAKKLINKKYKDYL